MTSTVRNSPRARVTGRPGYDKNGCYMRGAMIHYVPCDEQTAVTRGQHCFDIVAIASSNMSCYDTDDLGAVFYMHALRMEGPPCLPVGIETINY